MAQFEIGKTYKSADAEVEPITIRRRTAKTITATNSLYWDWTMRIRTDKDGNEFVTDSFVPKSLRGERTYFATMVTE